MNGGGRLIGNHQPVERRLPEPERYFAAQNTVSGTPLTGYNQHPPFSRLGRSGEKASQTRPRAGRRQPMQINARINRDGAARQPSPRFRIKARLGHWQFFRHRAGWRFDYRLCSVNAFRIGGFSGGRLSGVVGFGGTDAARFNMSRAPKRGQGFGLRRDARPKLGIFAG
jgi:hypothetical protein